MERAGCSARNVRLGRRAQPCHWIYSRRVRPPRGSPVSDGYPGTGLYGVSTLLTRSRWSLAPAVAGLSPIAKFWPRAGPNRRPSDAIQLRLVERPEVYPPIRQLVVRMGRRIPGWGSTRIRGALKNVRHRWVGRRSHGFLGIAIRLVDELFRKSNGESALVVDLGSVAVQNSPDRSRPVTGQGGRKEFT